MDDDQRKKETKKVTIECDENSKKKWELAIVLPFDIWPTISYHID